MIVLTVIAAVGLATIFLILAMNRLSEKVTEEIQEVRREVRTSVEQTLGDHGTRLEGLLRGNVHTLDNRLGKHCSDLERLLQEFERLIRSKRVEGLATVADLRDEAKSDREIWQAAIQNLHEEARADRKEAREERRHFECEIRRLSAELEKKGKS